MKKSCETFTPRLIAFSRSTSRKSFGVLATKVLFAEAASLFVVPGATSPRMSNASLSAAAASSLEESEPSLVR